MSNSNVSRQTKSGTGSGTGVLHGTDVRAFINSDGFRVQLARVLPKHMTPDMMARVALTAAIRTPDLLACDLNTIAKCLLDLGSVGLPPDGYHAHLIPRKNKNFPPGVLECTAIIDYKGLVALAFRSGVVESIDAQVIHEGDYLEYDSGSVKSYVPHFLRKDVDRPAAQGKAIGAFCKVRLKDGAEKSEVMSKDEIEKVRKSSRAGGDGPWVEHPGEMWKKTVFRRASKWIPRCPEMVQAQQLDEDRIIEAVTARVAHSTINLGHLLPGTAAQQAMPEPPEPSGHEHALPTDGTHKGASETAPEAQPASQSDWFADTMAAAKKCKTRDEMQDILDSINFQIEHGHKKAPLALQFVQELMAGMAK